MGGENVRVAYPLFQVEGGGSSPTSPLQFEIVEINIKVAQELNALWHSRMPIFKMPISTVCFGAVFESLFYASAIWSNPVARNLDQYAFLELRRLAIAPDAPKNTASRMLGIMARLIKRKRPNITKLISYQDMEVHQGTIYKASGWYSTQTRSAGFWSCKSRPRPDLNQVLSKKLRWEKDI